MMYIKAFLVGGAICALSQVLIDRTRLTPARILTSYVVLGVVLSAVGVYEPLVKWAGCGATVPIRQTITRATASILLIFNFFFLVL